MAETKRHWTYDSAAVVLAADLEQGDILRPTTELSTVFKEVHPHFVNQKYLGFLVTTQSCDLVRRDGNPCQARYINIAAIRLLEHVLLRLLDTVCDPFVPGVYPEELRGKAENLITRVINQNEQNFGIFYLHPDAGIGIDQPAVALLRISVALRADHYEVLQRSRIGRLAKEFRAKLGWLVGNMYSRIGTEDWSEPKERRAAQRELVKQVLESENPENRPLWVPRNQKRAAEKAGVDIRALTRATILDVLAQHRPPARVDTATDIAKGILAKLLDGGDAGVVEKFASRLRNDPAFAALLK